MKSKAKPNKHFKSTFSLKSLSSFKKPFSWLTVSELTIPLLTAASVLAVFIALPPSRLNELPRGPIINFGESLQAVAVALHFEPQVEPGPTDRAADAPTSNKSKVSNQNVESNSSSDPGHFGTLPPGSSLPSDASCAARVRSAPEVRPANSTFNNTKGVGGNTEFPRVTGNFTGTTDEIFQWAACKWGIDENIVKAQAVKESWWFHRTMGDFTTDPNLCWPPNNILGTDGKPGQCPESVGILQVRYEYHKSGLAAGTYSPYYSTAYNADYTYAVWRDCYEGNMTWLNSVEKGATYAAGDEWGCVGEWFSGRWLTAPTMPYINAVKDYMNKRMWENPDFLSAT